MDRSAYVAIVRDAIDALPDRLREQVKDVAIVIDDVCEEDEELLGLYEGVPITEWGKGFESDAPDTITLFRDTIEAEAESEEEIPHVVRETLWHELAHHFGFEHDKIDEMEERWVRKRDDA